MGFSFEEILIGGSEEQLNELKRWLFEENIRISIKQKELDDLHEKFLTERIQFQEEMKDINLRVVTERKRLKDEEEFFDKKMEILKNGFASLEQDRRQLARERKVFEAEQRTAEAHAKSMSQASRAQFADETVTGLLFAGCNNPLVLKKRYRDLLKIFHPDNYAGDNTMVTIINREYDRLKKEMDYPFRTVK